MAETADGLGYQFLGPTIIKKSWTSYIDIGYIAKTRTDKLSDPGNTESCEIYSLLYKRT